MLKRFTVLLKLRKDNSSIRGKLGDASTLFSSGETNQEFVPYADDEVDELPTINKNKPVEDDGVAQFEASLTDVLIQSEVHLLQGMEI